MSADLQWMLLRKNSCFLLKNQGSTFSKVGLNFITSSHVNDGTFISILNWCKLGIYLGHEHTILSICFLLLGTS